MHLDGFCLSFYCHELNERLLGARIGKIIQINPQTIGLPVKSRTTDACLIINANPDRPSLHLGELPGIRQEQAPAFCMLLRKHLENGRIAAIRQHAADRVLTIEIDSLGADLRIATKNLTFEWTGRNCNLIFWQDGVVLDAVRYIGYKQNRVRQIYPQLPYVFPPAGESLFLEPQHTTGSLITAALQEAAQDDRPIAKQLLSITTGLGPLTVRQLLFEAGLPENQSGAKMEQPDWQSLAEAWDSLLERLRQNGTTPTRLIDARGKSLAILPFLMDASLLKNGQQQISYESLTAALYAYYREQPTQTPLTDTLREKLEQEKIRLARRLVKITAEKEAAENSELTRQLADSLMSQPGLTIAPIGETMIANIYDEKAYPFPLDPLLSVMDNAQALYKRYRKQRRAAEELTQQLAQGEELLSYLDNLLYALDTIVNRAELEEIKQEMQENNLLPKEKKKASVAHSEPLMLHLPDGDLIAVGRNNRQNDWLTLKWARSGDWWFHTQKIPGSHVILRTQEEKPTDVKLLLAASLAAYFSKGRSSSQVPVDYTRRKYVKKPGGAKPGFVIYQQQRTLYITPEEEKVTKFITQHKK